MVVKISQKEKCVVVLSGGPYSTTVAYWAKNKGYDLYGITYNYGQIATKEVEQAEIISEKLEIPIKIIDLSSLKEIFKGVTSLCDESIEMTSAFSQPIIVPFRNAIFLSITVAYSISLGAKKIFYGAQGSDEPFYPDCRKEFYKALENTAKIGTDTEIIIEAPFNNIKKSEILKIGSKLGVPYSLTWSCYKNEIKHCGKCESCINRKKAFLEAELQDPTDYLE